MSEEHRCYVLWAMGICSLVCVLSIVLECVGLKPLSTGQVMTTVVLVIAIVVLGIVYWRTGRNNRTNR